MKHFTRFIPRGSLLLNVSDACGFGVVASFDAVSTRLVMIVANQELEDRILEFPISGFRAANPSKQTMVSVWRTSETESFERIDRYRILLPYPVGIIARAVTITSVVIDNVSLGGPVQQTIQMFERTSGG